MKLQFKDFFKTDTDKDVNTYVEFNRPIDIIHKEISPKYLMVGDEFQLKYNNEQLLCKEIDRDMIIDRVSVFTFTDALGYKEAFGGIFGTKR